MKDLESAKDIAYGYIRSLIMSMDIHARDFIKEEEVAEATRLSRTPVREALLRLEAEKLVQLLPKKGAFVPPISSREMEELMEARELLETFAAPAAIEASERLIKPLTSLLKRQRTLSGASGLEEFIELDRKFHSSIVEATGNSVITDIYNSLRTRQLRMALNVISLSVPREERLRRVIAEHAAILDALRTGDLRQTRAAIRAHCAATLAAGQRRNMVGR